MTISLPNSFTWVRVLPRSKFVIFIAGIVLISTVAGIFSSFFGGFEERDFFLESSDDVMTVVQPGVKTPAVSYVPASMASALSQMPGVLSISGEVHSLVMVRGQPVTLHGITNDFHGFVQARTLDGQSLRELTSQPVGNQLIAGQAIAEVLGLEVGQSYQLFSTTSEGYASFTVVGVVSFGSFHDEELFTTVAMSQFMRPTSAKTDLSMIRLKLDRTVVSKEELGRLILQQFLVRLYVVPTNETSVPPSVAKVDVFTTNGLFVSSNQTSSGVTFFFLPIGVYEFVVTVGSITERFTKLISQNTTLYHYYTASSSSGGPSTAYDLAVETYYNGEFVNGVAVRVVAPSGQTYSLVSSPTSKLTGLAAGRYTIQGTYNTIREVVQIELTQSRVVQLNLSFPVTLVARSLSGSPLANISCSVLDHRTNQTQFFNQCPSSTYLERSLYTFTFHSDALGNRSVTHIVAKSSSNQLVSVVLGNASTLFRFRDGQNNPLVGATVYGSPSETQPLAFIGLTNETGSLEVSTPVGEQWLFKVDTPNPSYFSFTPANHSTEEIVLQEPHLLSFQVVNGSDPSLPPLGGVSVSMTTSGGQTTHHTTDEQGLAGVVLGTVQMVNFTVTTPSYNKTVTVNSRERTAIQVPVGPLSVLVRAETKGGYPLEDATVEVISNSGNQSYSTSDNGELSLALPSSSTLLPVLDELGQQLSPLLVLRNNDFLLDFAYLINVTWHEATQTFVVPKTYLAQHHNFLFQFPYQLVGTFSFVDYTGRLLSNALVELKSLDNPTNFIGVSNSKGRVVIADLDPGQYELEIMYRGLSFTENFWLNSTQSLEFELPIVSSDLQSYVWKPNLALVTGKEYLDAFYDTSVDFFFQTGVILVVTTITVLMFLFSSSMQFVIENATKEIAIAQVLGASRWQIILHMLVQMQLRSLVSSVVGLLVGGAIAVSFPAFRNIALLGFVIHPRVSIELLVLSTLTINVLTLGVLMYTLWRFDWSAPLRVIQETLSN